MLLMTIFTLKYLWFESPERGYFDQRADKSFFLLSTRLPPHAVQRIPITVRLIIILSKSINAITGTNLHRAGKVWK